MNCIDGDKVRPLDEILDGMIEEFESGMDKVCSKDLDTMIWKLGDYENDEPSMEAAEYREESPLEEELVEKTMTVGRNGRISFREDPEADESLFTGAFAAAGSIGAEGVRKGAAAAKRTVSGKGSTTHGLPPGKKKK
jgi:hypothetical protein